MAYIGANLNGYKTMDDFQPLPPGEYHVCVVDSKVDQKDTGVQASFTYEIIGQENARRKVFDRMWIQHKNPDAAEVGLRRLKTMATAAGHQNPNMVNDTEELHGRELMIKVAIRKDEKTGNEYNDVKAYKPLAAGMAQAPANMAAPSHQYAATGTEGMPTPSPAQRPAGTPKRPWDR